MTENAILLSVRPKYAEKILVGEKKVELRRIRPRVRQGDLVIIYAASPVMAIIGFFNVDNVITGSPKDLWPVVKHRACITKEEFNNYYEGAKLGVAIFFSKSQALRKPLPLNKIRKAWPDFRPPRGYRYLAPMNGRAKIFTAALRMHK